MKAPNLASVVAILGVLLPAVMRVVSDSFAPTVYWQSALIVGLIAALIKAIEVWSAQQPLPLAGVSYSDAPLVEQRSKLAQVLFD